MEKYPDILDKKMKLLSYFCCYMSEHLMKAGASVHVQVQPSKESAIFEPVVLRLMCSCEASDQWDTTGEEFCQSGINLFPCGNYLSVASLMYQICFVQLWLILIICDYNKCTFISEKSTNIDKLHDAGGTGK